MKKVMIGILIIIPIIILLIVALVTNIVSLNAHIAVEDLQLTHKDTQNTAYSISIPIQGDICLYDFIDAKISPAQATDKTIEWQIAGDVRYTDTRYEEDYKQYQEEFENFKNDLAEKFDDNLKFNNEEQAAYEAVVEEYYYDSDDKDMIVSAMADRLYNGMKVAPAAVFVDENGEEVVSNTSGKMAIGAHCDFTVRAVAENVSRTISISIVGYDVEQVVISVPEGKDDTIEVGQSMRLLASYTPIQSIVNKTKWSSDHPDVLSVDSNGVVTALRASSEPVKITLEASIYSSEKGELKYKSGEISLSVKSKGLSTKFGNRVIVSRNASFTLEQLGIEGKDVDLTKLVSNEDGTYSLKDVNSVTLGSGEDILEIVPCASDAIEIRHASMFANGNYVLSVGENTLKLDAVWSDMLNDGDAPVVDWESSDKSIAIVDKKTGEVTGVGDGVVEIRVYYGGKVCCSIQLNVRRKLSSIQLRTSNEALAVGLARETVFAGDRYEDVSSGNNKIANSTLVIVQSEPSDSDPSEIKAFYDAFTFEIVEGSEYASMDKDVANKVVFNNSALEGKGKQNVVVRVSAKYPKYEGVTKFTTEDVTLVAVFGVQVGNMDELQQACKDQESYVKGDGNVVELSDQESLYWACEGEKEVYKVYRNNYSLNDYAIVLEDNCRYEEQRDSDGDIVASVDWDKQVAFYGNVYGNNNKISATNGSIDKVGDSDEYLIRVGWGGITISNLILRAGEHDLDDTDTDEEESNGVRFTGIVCLVDAGTKRWFESDGNDITFEYSIIENSNKAVELYNTDITFKGCVIRNMMECGIYAPFRMASTKGKLDATTGKQIVYPKYSHINLHNVICSNTLGSMLSVTYEAVTMQSSIKFRFVDGKKYSGDDEQKIAESKRLEAKNEQFFMDNFYKNGINMVVNQTGFLRSYNWMNVKDAGLIKTGSDELDAIIGEWFDKIVEGDTETFKDYLYIAEDGEKYLHFSFIVTGISMTQFIFDGKTYLQLNQQDNDYNCFNIQDVDFNKVDLEDWDEIKSILQQLSLKVYGYDNKADINPFSTYQLNAALIAQLHK